MFKNRFLISREIPEIDKGRWFFKDGKVGVLKGSSVVKNMGGSSVVQVMQASSVAIWANMAMWKMGYEDYEWKDYRCHKKPEEDCYCGKFRK